MDSSAPEENWNLAALDAGEVFGAAAEAAAGRGPNTCNHTPKTGSGVKQHRLIAFFHIRFRERFIDPT